MKIFIIQSGFVYIGEGERVTDELLGNSIMIKEAKNVRRWGTEKNLGQLAYEGKQPNTILDYTGTITVPVDKLIHTIDIQESVKDTFIC